MTTTTNATMTQSTTLIQSLPTGVQGTPRTCTVLSERDVHSSVQSSLPFRSPFCRSWWFGRTQDNATTRQPGILCGWAGRPKQSSTGHSFGTYIINFQKHAQDIFFTFLLHWLTVSRVRTANIVRRTCSNASHITAPYKLSFYYYHYTPTRLPVIVATVAHLTTRVFQFLSIKT